MGFIGKSWGNPSSPKSPASPGSYGRERRPALTQIILRQFQGSVLTRAFPVAFFSTSISMICVLLRRGVLGDQGVWMAASIVHPLGVQVFGIMFAFLITNRATRAIERRWDGMSVVSQMYLKFYDAYAFVMSYIKKDLQILLLRREQEALTKDKKEMLDERIHQIECFRDKITHWFSLMNALALGTVKFGENRCRGELHKCKKPIQWKPKSPKDRNSVGTAKGFSSKMDILRRSFGGGFEEADRLEYLGDIEPSEDAQLDAVEDKPLHVMQWICDALVLADEESLVSIPSPLLAQLFLELQDGVQSYQAAYRLAAVPYPFPMAQMIDVMMKFFICVAPVVIENFTQGWVLTPILSFLTILSYYGLNAVSVELENPFGEDVNDLPLHELCATLNDRILELGCSHVQDAQDTVHDFSGLFAKHRLPTGPIGWENLIPHKPHDPATFGINDPHKAEKEKQKDHKESVDHDVHLPEKAGGEDQQHSHYKLKPYIKKGVQADKKGQGRQDRTVSKDATTPNLSSPNLASLGDTDSESGIEEPKKPPDPGAVVPQKPIGTSNGRRVLNIGSTSGSARPQGHNSQAGTGECSTPAAVVPGSASIAASESSNSINPSVTSVVPSPDVGPSIGGPVHALAQHSHRTEALLQQSVGQYPRPPGESPAVSSMAQIHAGRGGYEERAAGDAQYQHSPRPPDRDGISPNHQDAVQIISSGRPGQLGSDEWVYATVAPSQSSAASAEYRRLAVEDGLMPAQSLSSYSIASSPSGLQARARPYTQLSGRTYAVNQAGGLEQSPHYAIAQPGELATVPGSLPASVPQAVSQQSPRYMYVMLPRTHQRSYTAGGYTSSQNPVAVAQQVVQQGVSANDYVVVRSQGEYDDLC